MRTLNRKQKDYIKSRNGNLSKQDYEVLKKMNDHETLHQNIERFVDDILFERQRSKSCL